MNSKQGDLFGFAFLLTVGLQSACRDPEPSCSGGCAIEDTRRCNANIVETCTVEASGCLQWRQELDCAQSDQSCVVTQGQATCAGECFPACNNEGRQRCMGAFVQRCIQTTAACLVWRDEVECDAAAQYCDDTGAQAQCQAFGTEFPIRVPQGRELECPSPWSEDEPPVVVDYFSDTDHVCQFYRGAITTEIYVQATPTGCAGVNGGSPTFDDSVQAWMKTDTGIVPVEATYNWGGNHHVDWLTVTIEGLTYVVAHSSMGWGGRSCAPPDCVKVCQSGVVCDGWANVQENGCERAVGSGAPPLPAICVVVAADGSVPELLDPWQTQASAPTYPILPCEGES